MKVEILPLGRYPFVVEEFGRIKNILKIRLEFLPIYLPPFFFKKVMSILHIDKNIIYPCAIPLDNTDASTVVRDESVDNPRQQALNYQTKAPSSSHQIAGREWRWEAYLEKVLCKAPLS